MNKKNELLDKSNNPDFLWEKVRNLKKSDNLLISRLKLALNKNIGASHLNIIIGYICDASNKNKNIRILDYGSGGGQLVTYLYFLGFCNIDAVDIYTKKEVDKLNSLFNILDIKSGKFYRYDTKILPFEDEKFDLIISQQVIEHVSNIEQYLKECYRVSSDSGKVLLDFPHRLVPFDTHSRMWFVHYFPVFIRKPIYDKYRPDAGGYKYYSKLLYLKTPFYYYYLFRQIFTSIDDLTADRISSFRYKDHYEGNVRIRSIMNNIFNIPFIGKLFLSFFSIFSNKTVILQK